MKRRLQTILRNGIMAAGVLLIVVTVLPIPVWLGGLLAGPWGNANGETLIVLTGSSLENGLIGESSYWRSIYAVLFWREANYKTIWISGYGPEPNGNAAVMRRFLIGHGVPADIIQLDAYSSTTQASARSMAARLAGDASRKVLLTSDYHMFRSRRMFAREGLDVVALPIPDAQKRGERARTRWQAFLDVCEELVKVAWYGVRGML